MHTGSTSGDTMIESAFILNYKDYDKNAIEKLGIKELFFSLDTPESILADACKSFKVFIEFKPFESHRNPVTNVFDEKKDLKVLSCPTNRELWKRNLDNLRGKIKHADGVVLDFVRYPSFSAGNFFFSCFCENCKKFAEEHGYDFNLIKESALSFYRKDFEKSKYWFEFKNFVLKSYLEYFENKISIEKRAFVFSPSLSYFVGQDYDVFLKYLDKLHPMVYPEGSLGPACIGYEAYHLSLLLNIDLQDVYEILGIKISNLPKSRDELFKNGMPDEIIYHEVKKFRQNSVPIITTLNIPHSRIKRRFELCREAGLKRVAIFGFNKKDYGNLVKACSE